MNITILANKDLASNIALNYLVKGLSDHHLKVFLSDQVGASSNKPLPLIDLQFFEQHLFNKILFPGIDSNSYPSGVPQSNLPESNITKNTKLLTFNHLQQIISSPIEALNNINEADGLKQLSATEPDLILSVRFGKILRDAAIAVPKLGVLNLHSGLLPQYQGVMATFWAMFYEEQTYGTTLHFIDSKAIDSGPIISTTQMPLDLTQSYLTNVLALYEGGCNNMVQAVNALSGKQPIQTKPHVGKPQYFSFPTQSQLNDFSTRGMRLFDITQIQEIVESYQSS